MPLAEQSILYSDPNFLKQQQFLEKAKEDVAIIQEEIPTEERGVLRSNLSAMFDQQKPKKKPTPSKNTAMNFGEGSVDHNRRFSELQARFRVHYNTKKSPKLEENALLNRRKSPLELSLNKNILKLNNRDKKVAGNPKKPSNSTLNSPTTSNDPTSPIACSFPSRTMPIQIQRVHRTNAQPYDLEQRQKRLDDQLVRADFNDITVSELKEMLRQRGKPATGKKAILLQRLQEERDFIQLSRDNGVAISSRYLQQSPVIDSSSLPENMFLSSSPASLGSLNRSIADMRISSPPPNALTIPSSNHRRFSPYTSPRNSLSSPSYSTSVPSSTAGGHVFKKSYAPFTSSALATPDREEDYNPFDSARLNPIEWSDPSIESMMHGNIYST
ncbi:hypothetical protein BY458DRAFT_439768 [Sporodiniella umbellata]|nr:hypothetical protein BY458DRAFT_439768 [Sporodiniella umbellata]